MGFRDIHFKNSYTGKGERILKEFLLPLLSSAKKYDRITGYYTIESLLAISQGIESLYWHDGKMRLIIGVHSVPKAFVDATLKQEALRNEVAKVRSDIKEQILSLTDALECKRLATIAWMIEDGLLEIKAASTGDGGIFHPKTIILADENNDKVAAVGSSNETRSGLGGNFEQLVVLDTWHFPQSAVATQEEFFEQLWNNEHEDATVIDISDETAGMLSECLGQQYPNPKRNNSKSSGAGLFSNMAAMPMNFFVSGDVPALYMHQERAVLDALSRWPVRVLLADEVGLGKTFEAATILVYLVRYCNVKRVVVLTPKAVQRQWQEELFEHFGITAWLYDSSRKQYISPTQTIIDIGEGSPLGPDAPDLVLISAQYARGNSDRGSIFDQDGVIYPDLLIVDEAHSARVSTDISGAKKKTLMYKVLERVSDRIPHIVLATATPMQISANEYHAMLKLLGLPKAWQPERAFDLSLKLIRSSQKPDLSDASAAAGLLQATINLMKPGMERLSSAEKDLLNDLYDAQAARDLFDQGELVINNWDIFRTAFIKLHPASLLTVRNTRRALENFGYTFPERKLIASSVNDTVAIQAFYSRVNNYITKESFSIEKALEPDRSISVGFVRVSYQQRVASSLYSCAESLKRRYAFAMEWSNRLAQNKNPLAIKSGSFSIDDLMDNIESDELFENDLDTIVDEHTGGTIDINELQRAVSVEITSLGSLIQEADRLLGMGMDYKIVTAIELLQKCLEKGDSVLVFSRYTDTVAALLKEVCKERLNEQFEYGVYTGDEAYIVTNGTREDCDKTRIKSELFSHKLRFLLCSDAASEGLNLQAARVIINVDVPWTPSRLEQRIGRIARLGQSAKEVDIYNVWYPNSIEAQMYTRIQKRLDEAGLALGEFPDIVAEGIKNAVLDNDSSDDTGLKELSDYRNSYQTLALEELWSNQGKRYTTSETVRKTLMQICNEEFEKADSGVSGSIQQFVMPDGTVENLTDLAGMEESISLKSRPWEFKDFDVNGITLTKDQNGVPMAWRLTSDLDKAISSESILELIEHGASGNLKFIDGWPNMLPNHHRLSMDFTVEGLEQKAPEMW